MKNKLALTKYCSHKRIGTEDRDILDTLQQERDLVGDKRRSVCLRLTERE